MEGATELYGRAGFIVGPPRELADYLVQRDVQVPGFYLSMLSPPRPPAAILDLIDPASSPGFAAVHLDDFDDELPGAFRDDELEGVGTLPMAGVEHVSDPALQQHPNTVFAVAGVVIVAKNPSDHHIFLSAFTRQRELRATSAGITAPTGRGDLSIVDPTAFRGLYGIAPPNIAEAAKVAAVRFKVRDRAALVAALNAGAVPFISHMGNVVIGLQTAMGATLVFEGG